MTIESEVAVTIRTAVDTRQGCPYGLAGEQAILASEMYVEWAGELKPDLPYLDKFFAANHTAIEADGAATDIAGAILGCDTCGGDPHSVDLTNKVCAFAIESSMGNVIKSQDIRDYQENSPQFGN